MRRKVVPSQVLRPECFFYSLHITHSLSYNNWGKCIFMEKKGERTVKELSMLNLPDVLQKWDIVQSRRRPPTIFMVEMIVIHRLFGTVTTTDSHNQGEEWDHVYMVTLGHSAFLVKPSWAQCHTLGVVAVLQFSSVNYYFPFGKQVDWLRCKYFLSSPTTIKILNYMVYKDCDGSYTLSKFISPGWGRGKYRLFLLVMK